PPRERLDQPAAEQGAHRPGHPGPRRPKPDRPGAVLLGDERLDERQAARREQRPTDALEAAGHDELLDARREAAHHRGHAEPADPHEEDPPSSEPVTERPADEDEG